MEYSYINTQQQRKKVLRPSAFFNSVNTGGSRISKISQINGPVKMQQKPIKPQIVFKQKQITDQLQKQFLQIEKCLNDYQPFLKHLQQKQSNKSIKNKIFTLQDSIKSKDREIDDISQEIQCLKQVNKSTKTSKFQNKGEENNPQNQYARNSHLEQNQNPLFKLAQQLKSQRQLLENTQSEHQQKRSKLIEITSLVHQMELKFMEKCKKTKEKFITYENFKQMKIQKNKQKQNDHKVQKKVQKTIIKPKQSSIRQAQKFFSFSTEIKRQNIQPVNDDKKTLKDLQNKKVIAQQALKNSKKKHNNELRQSMAKIQFLRQEQSLLYEKIKQKQEEKMMLQAKFQEKGGSFPFSTHRLFNPTIGTSRDQRMKTGANLKPNNLQSPSRNPIKQKSLQKLQNHHFSPHRKLVSAKKNVKQFEIENENYNEEYRPHEKKESPFFYEFENGQKYDDYEERTFNPQSKNSFRQPSTNLNDSLIENY